MAIEPAFVTRLEAVAALTALIADRIYPNEAPRGEPYPYLTYFRVSTQRTRSLGGQNRLTMTRLQVEAISDKYSDVKGVGEQLRQVIEATETNPYPQTWGSIRVQYAKVEDQTDTAEQPKSAEDQLLHHEEQDIVVWWEETVT